MVFGVDALGAWLVEQLANAGLKKLTALVFGDEQERALRQAAAAAVQETAAEMSPSGGEQGKQIAMVISEVFGKPVPDAPLARVGTLLEGLQAGIARQLAVLDDADLTGTGKSSAEVLGVSGALLADSLADHLVQEILLRGSRGGPLAPLADQLNHDQTHLQGQRIEQEIQRLLAELKVFAKPGEEALVPEAVGLGSYTERGHTTNFNVYYNNSLGANGQGLADAVIGRCEQDFAQLQAWFGVTPDGLPFNIYIDPGEFGAYHFGCSATELHLAAFAGTDGVLVNMFNVAIAGEVMMAAQNKGWNCGTSVGEGLSRVLATERYPATLGGFASAAGWLDSDRPDWVTYTEPTDRDYVSIGCATLFLNYLRYQLGFPWTTIVQAGGTTLAQTYQTITGRTDAFAAFAALLQSRFPVGQPSGLTNDNPFPIVRNRLP